MTYSKQHPYSLSRGLTTKKNTRKLIVNMCIIKLTRRVSHQYPLIIYRMWFDLPILSFRGMRAEGNTDMWHWYFYRSAQQSYISTANYLKHLEHFINSKVVSNSASSKTEPTLMEASYCITMDSCLQISLQLLLHTLFLNAK